METDVRRNPGLLKLDLYCRGMRLDDSCTIEEKGGRKILRTRAGLGSGLELILPGELWTNVPVVEEFVAASPYTLRWRDGAFWIDHETLGAVTTVRLSPQPAWYNRTTSTGKRMTMVGTLQGTYLGVYPSKVCDYWLKRPDKEQCKFCSVGLNLGADDGDEKSVEEVVEVVKAARAESGITYVDFNTGHYDGDTYLDILEPYIRRREGRDQRDDRRSDAAARRPVALPRRCGGWASIASRSASRSGTATASRRSVPGSTASTASTATSRRSGTARRRSARQAAGSSRGSSTARSSRGSSRRRIPSARSIGSRASARSRPCACSVRFRRPTTPGVPPPKTEDIVPVFRRLYEATMERGLPIGVAQNVHVSLVMLPEEARWLQHDPNRFWMGELEAQADAQGVRDAAPTRAEKARRVASQPRSD